MQKLSIYLFLIFIVSSCQQSVSVKKDLISGTSIQVRGNGITCEDTEIRVNDTKFDSKPFLFGDEITLAYQNVEGLVKVNSKVYPGLKIVVLDEKKDTVFFEEDVYKDFEGYSGEPFELTAHLNIGRPMFSGHKYKAVLDFWDKNGKGEMHSEFDFKAFPNENLHAQSKEFTYKEIFLFSKNKEKVVSDNTFESGDVIYFMFDGLEGLKEENGMVFPCLKVQVKNERGETILNDENLFNAYYDIGLDKKAASERIYFQLNADIKIAKTFDVHAVLVDKLSEAVLIFDTKIKLKN